MIGPGLSFRDVPVTWRGQAALVQARRIGNRVQLSSIRVPGIRDDRGRARDEVFSGESGVAFDGIQPEEWAGLMGQVVEALA